jgi:hypothetical protein
MNLLSKRTVMKKKYHLLKSISNKKRRKNRKKFKNLKQKAHSF